ncbi:MAG: hypothetical protein NC252_04730 [Roseburia sp.]|nr:hypothetical protein [Roseburia sp.]
MSRLVLIIAFCAAFLDLSAQQAEWQPTGVWPFAHRRFETATVVSGFVKMHKTTVPCNIHLGNQTLWYVQNDTLMEAVPGTILRVEFPKDVYIPVGGNKFGKIIREDSIGGTLARVIKVEEVDYRELKRNSLESSEVTSSMLASAGGLFSSLAARISDANAGLKAEEQPIPIAVTYYFVYKNEVFEASEKNILKYIDPARKREYRAFTRSAEIISRNESSIMKVWENFFLK